MHFQRVKNSFKEPLPLKVEKISYFTNISLSSLTFCVVIVPFPSSDYIQTCMILLKTAGHKVADWVSISGIIGIAIYDIGYWL